MKIEKITLQNFYSYKNEEFILGDYSGLTLIKGVNKDTGGSNGSGKSVLIEAVYFALTGKTIRKSTEDSLVNNEAKKHCVVQIELEHKGSSVVVTRQKKPTKLEFLVGGENRTQQSVITTQAAIDEFLNINHKVLLASMFFGQSNDLNFLDCTADDKRTIIRNFLNLDDIFQMRDRIRDFKSTFYQDVKTKDAIIHEKQNSIKKLDKKIKEIVDAQEEYGRFVGYPEDLTLDSILEEEKSYSSIQWQRDNLVSKLAQEENTLVKNKKLLKNPEKTSNCPTCSQSLPKKVFTKNIEKEVEAGHKAIGWLKENIRKHEGELVTPRISSTDYSKYLSYKELCRDKTNYFELRHDLADEIATHQRQKEESKIQYEVMRFWEKAFSEQGVVKYIINNILEYFNERCNYYLSYLTNSKYSVEFDQELAEKIETSGRLLSYISLSGGEKRKVNLAITLGLKDLLLLTDKSHIDLLFFDEVAENIDEEGVQGLYQLLQEIKKDKTIFIITHNKHLKTLLDSSKRVTIIKSKGTSKIIN